MSSEIRPVIRFAAKKRSTNLPTSTTTILHEIKHWTDPIEPTVKTTFAEKLKNRITTGPFQPFQTNEKSTTQLGFFDSMFTSEETEELYLRIGAIILWIFAFISLLLAIGFLIKSKKSEFRMILIHILFYEFFYLSYILFSMINVAMDYRLNPMLCDFANYGMYFTIPLMSLALVFLSMERLTKHCSVKKTWVKICSSSIIVQIFLFIFWLIFIIGMIIWIGFKEDLKMKLTGEIIGTSPDLVKGLFATVEKKTPICSVDGRLSPVIKIILMILLVLMIVLLIKSLIIGFCNDILKKKICCKESSSQDETQKSNSLSTATFILIILCNTLLTYPFYIFAMGSFIFTNIESTKVAFTKTMKMSFLIRISSILLQSLVILLIEGKCRAEFRHWNQNRKMKPTPKTTEKEAQTDPLISQPSVSTGEAIQTFLTQMIQQGQFPQFQMAPTYAAVNDRVSMPISQTRPPVPPPRSSTPSLPNHNSNDLLVSNYRRCSRQP